MWFDTPTYWFYSGRGWSSSAYPGSPVYAFGFVDAGDFARLRFHHAWMEELRTRRGSGN
ncbi:MAG: hypothetical protein AB8B51_14045 [Sedimentitalea sp.]